jgi:Phage capsid family
MTQIPNTCLCQVLGPLARQRSVLVGSFHIATPTLSGTTPSSTGLRLVINGDHVGFVKDKAEILGLPASAITEISYGQDVHRRVQNLVEWPNEDSFSSGAGYQVNEADVKGESTAAFSLKQSAIATVAHWLAVSKQVVDDSLAFEAYINQRLLYKLNLFLEHELLYAVGGAVRILCANRVQNQPKADNGPSENCQTFLALVCWACVTCRLDFPS